MAMLIILIATGLISFGCYTVKQQEIVVRDSYISQLQEYSGVVISHAQYYWRHVAF